MLLGRKEISDSALDKDFTLFELKKALDGAKTPLQAGMEYVML